MLKLEKYTIGVGDRFAHQAKAQLQACVKLAQEGVEVIPVWNKSNREHSFIGSEPQSVYDAAKLAVGALSWGKGWHVDADHINLDTIDKYLESSDFFTIDVADYIGQSVEADVVAAFVEKHPELDPQPAVPEIIPPDDNTTESENNSTQPATSNSTKPDGNNTKPAGNETKQESNASKKN